MNEPRDASKLLADALDLLQEWHDSAGNGEDWVRPNGTGASRASKTLAFIYNAGRALATPSPETGTAAVPTDGQWVIVAAHISTNGVAYFWGPNFSGYTASLARAGRYTEQEAKKREVWSERMEVAVPLAEAEEAQFPAVTDDNAHAWFRRRFPGPKPAAGPAPEPVKPPATFVECCFCDMPTTCEAKGCAQKERSMANCVKPRQPVNRMVVRDALSETCPTCAGLGTVATQWPSGYPHATPCPECRPDYPCGCGVKAPQECPSIAAVAEWKREHGARTPAAGTSPTPELPVCGMGPCSHGKPCIRPKGHLGACECEPPTRDWRGTRP